MEKEIILGKVSSLADLLKLLDSRESGVILIDKVIDCCYYELNCYSGVILRGGNKNCGLRFAVETFAMPLLRLNSYVQLENLRLDFYVRQNSPDAEFGCVLIQGYGVRFTNIKVSLCIKQEMLRYRRPLPAIYVQHPLFVNGHFSMTVIGNDATQIKGNSTAKSRLKAKDAVIWLQAVNTIGQMIKDCVFRIDGSHSRFVYENINMVGDDFDHAYVLASKDVQILGILTDAEIVKTSYEADEEMYRLQISRRQVQKVRACPSLSNEALVRLRSRRSLK